MDCLLASISHDIFGKTNHTYRVLFWTFFFFLLRVNLENLSRRCRLSSTSENEACSSFKNPIFYLSLEWGIHIFSILTGSTVIIALLRTYTFVKLCCNASLNLHVAMFKGIVYAPIHFFNTNPSGLDFLLPVLVMLLIFILLVIIIVFFFFCRSHFK